MGYEGLKTKVLWLELGSQALPIPGNLLGTLGLALVVPYFFSVLPHPHSSGAFAGINSATESLKTPQISGAPQCGERDTEQKTAV